MAYDTVNDSWISIYGGLPRHTASSESDRVLGIINHNGPDDYLSEQEKNETSSGSVTHADGGATEGTMKRGSRVTPPSATTPSSGSSPSPCPE